MGEPVRVNFRDAIATITLDRPQVRNAFDLAMAGCLAAAVEEIDARKDVRAVVLAATGPVFCAGMDLKAFASTGERPVVEGRGAFGFVERPPRTPVVAAVEGDALGGGLELILACDVVVASREARFGLPEVRRGLTAAAGGVLRLPRRLPRNIAMEMVLTGAPIDAPRAERFGLVNRLVEPGAALAAATHMAAEIAANAPLATLAAKFLVDAALDWPASEAFRLQSPHTDAVRRSQDAVEGARAFTEKRAPIWTGT